MIGRSWIAWGALLGFVSLGCCQHSKESTIAKAEQDWELKYQSEHQLADAQARIIRLLIAKRVHQVETLERIPAGRITKVIADVVYIDLAYNDHITDGMTFEVYSRDQGVPAPDDDAAAHGKGSIEVVKIGQDLSECRLIHLEQGATLQPGDLIVNLVYSMSGTFGFTIYGNFDLSHTGTAKPEDADVLHRLVTTWGGKFSDGLSSDTAFLILGQQPVVPKLRPEDAQDAVEKAKYDRANDELAKYVEVRDQAKEMGIPILDQDRFMHLIGYYDMAAK